MMTPMFSRAENTLANLALERLSPRLVMTPTTTMVRVTSRENQMESQVAPPRLAPVNRRTYHLVENTKGKVPYWEALKLMSATMKMGRKINAYTTIMTARMKGYRFFIAASLPRRG